MKKIKNGFLTLFVILLKSTKIIAIIKSFKYAQIIFSLMTMVLSVACYSTQMGLQLALGLVILLFLHEMGHVVALKIKGYKVSAPVFIPFFGAVIFAPKFDDRDKEAYVAYGGVFIGTIFAVLSCIPYFFTGDKLWLAISQLGIFINLFNMIPMSPLDGGRITQAVHSKFKYIGLLILFIITLIVHDAGIMLIWILGLTEMNLRNKIKGILITVVYIIMCVLSAYSTESKYAIWEQLIFGGLFTLVFGIGNIILWDSDKDKPDTNKDTRPLCSRAINLKWGVCWAGLTIIQIAGLILLNHA